MKKRTSPTFKCPRMVFWIVFLLGISSSSLANPFDFTWNPDPIQILPPPGLSSDNFEFEHEIAPQFIYQLSSPKPSDSPSSTTAYNAENRRQFTKAVRTFAANYIRKLLQSPKYVDAFSLHKFSLEEAVKLYFDIVYSRNSVVGDRDTRFSSFSVSQAVRDNYEAVTNLYLMEVYGYSVGELLYQRGILTTENALDFSDQYYKLTSENIDAVGDSSPMEKLNAVADAFQKFLVSLEILTEVAFVVSGVFVEVFYALREY